MPSTPRSTSPHHHHRPSTPPASSPPSPSNPPSPSSPVDVPLLRLSPAATRVLPPTNRKMTDSTSNGNGLSATGFAQRERKQSNPLSQFRSNGSLRAAAQKGGGGANSTRGSSNRFGKSSAGGSSRGGGGGRYDASSVATGTTDGDEQESESDLLGLNSPSVGGRSAGSRKRGLPGRDGNGGMPMGLGGRGESDGEFDEGWTGGLEGEEEEEAGLLGGSREQVSTTSPSVIISRADKGI